MQLNVVGGAACDFRIQQPCMFSKGHADALSALIDSSRLANENQINIDVSI